VEKAIRSRQSASILIADDHSMFAEALRRVLEDEYTVLGIVEDGRKLVEEALRLKPEFIVADIGMPLLNGFDAVKQIWERLPKTRVVFLTMQEDPRLAASAVKLGAVGFVLKHSAASELLAAISEVLRGKAYVTARLRPRDWADRDELAQQLSKELTPRQREVLQLLAEGHTMAEVGLILEMSPKTVMFHKYRIMRTFNLKNNADLLRLAIKSNLIPQ
jgi:DNA-binding NarL/FixJ family response regulator